MISGLLSQNSGADYTPLRNLLALSKWGEADKETWDRMLEVAKQKDQGYLSPGDIEKIPCEDLQIIDRLWVDYSKTPEYPKGKFGFSVQKEIYEDCKRSVKDGEYSSKEIWYDFCCRVGWRIQAEFPSWMDYEDLIANPSISSVGAFPARWAAVWVGPPGYHPMPVVVVQNDDPDARRDINEARGIGWVGLRCGFCWGGDDGDWVNKAALFSYI